MKIAALIEARMTSSRLPGKVLLPACGRPLLDHMIDRLQRMHTIHEIIVATTTNRDDEPIVALAQQRNVGCFRGSEDDVLGRVVGAAQQYAVDVIVETTADCPLIDPQESDKVVQRFLEGDVDYASNVLKRSYPRGLDTQVFATKTLAAIEQRTTHASDREHPTFFIYNHPQEFRLANVLAPQNLTQPDLRLTVDTPEDYALITHIFDALSPTKPDFLLADIFALLQQHPEWLALNRDIQQKIPTYG